MEKVDVIHKIKQNVQEKFAELKSAVLMREKLLLRQLEVINTTSKQQLQSVSSDNKDCCVQFIGDNEKELLAAIRNFGRYQLTNLNLALQDVYLKNEDYIKPSHDHETLFKGLCHSIEQEELEDEDDECKESIVVDFSHHKSLMEQNAKLMNESIINITLKEAKELIMQAKNKSEHPVPPLNLEELDDEVESSIAEVVSSLEQGSLEHSELCTNNKYSQTQQTIKQKRFKPKITINNCNGTINLRNIASLTINCTTDDKVQAQIPVHYPNPEKEDDEAPSSTRNTKSKLIQKSKTLVESLVSSSSNTESISPTTTTNSNTPNSLSNYSSNNSSRSHSTKKTKSKKINKNDKSQNIDNKTIKHINKSDTQDNVVESSTSSMTNEVTCDFYNRLLDEIKKSIDQQQRVRSKCTSTNGNSQSTLQNADSSTNFNDPLGDESGGKRFILKNFENLKIILEAHSSGEDDSFHPVQIEQWLAEIISDTDLEPMQNTDILEHSKIFNEEAQET